MSLYDPQDLLNLSLSCVEREFPYFLDLAVDAPIEITRPKQLHPAFFGCSDYHSAVHNHWLLMRLQHEFPDLAGIGSAQRVLDEHLSPAAIGVERAYFDDPLNAAFSRPYGWAWILRLHALATTLPGPDAARWAAALAPLRDHLAASMQAHFGGGLQFPMRMGLHGNSAFALTFAIESARTIGDSAFEAALTAAARRMFGDDRDYPLILEPSGGDFLSPALTEAGLLATILEPVEFATWLGDFLPALGRLDAVVPLLQPPVFIRDNSDPATVHLNGLLLTKAWSLCRIAGRLPEGDARVSRLRASARAHWDEAQDALNDRHYHAIHWVPTFTVVAHEALLDAGLI